MNKHYLSVEQMKNLQALELDCSKASLRYEQYGNRGEKGKWIFDNIWQRYLGYNNERNCRNYKVIPCFDLQDILNILPKEIEMISIESGEKEIFHLFIDFWQKSLSQPRISYIRWDFDSSEEIPHNKFYNKNKTDPDFTGDGFKIENDNLIDAVYDMLVWCIKNKKL